MSQDGTCLSLPDNSDMKFDILHRESDAFLFSPELIVEEFENVSQKTEPSHNSQKSNANRFLSLQRESWDSQIIKKHLKMLHFICELEKSHENEEIIIEEQYKIKKYSGEIYSKLFEIFSIKKEEFISEWELDEEKITKNIKIHSNRGEKEAIVSGFSKNHRFIFKIIQKSQKKLIESLLLDYLKYFEDHESSFLVRLLGLYKLSVPIPSEAAFPTEQSFENIYFLFFTNTVWSGPAGASETLPIHQIYTLKGRQTQVDFFSI